MFAPVACRLCHRLMETWVTIDDWPRPLTPLACPGCTPGLYIPLLGQRPVRMLHRTLPVIVGRVVATWDGMMALGISDKEAGALAFTRGIGWLGYRHEEIVKCS